MSYINIVPIIVINFSLFFHPQTHILLTTVSIIEFNQALPLPFFKMFVYSGYSDECVFIFFRVFDAFHQKASFFYNKLCSRKPIFPSLSVQSADYFSYSPPSNNKNNNCSYKQLNLCITVTSFMYIISSLQNTHDR